MKHTPGPWAFAKYSKKRFGVGQRGEGAFFFLQCVDDDTDNPQAWADARLIAAAPELKAVSSNFEITGPDDDGQLWLVLHGNGTTGKAMFNLGRFLGIAGQVALLFEQDRRAAIAKATKE